MKLHHWSAAVAAVVLAVVPMRLLAQDELVLGAPIPITGPFASDGQAMQQAIELAVDQINDGGGLLGRPVRMEVFDIGDLTPDKLLAAGTSLVDQAGAAVLINGYGGMGPDIAAFCAYSVPYINNNATSNVVQLRNDMGCGNIFMGSDVDLSYARQSFAQINALGHAFSNKTIAIFHGPYDWELNTAEGFRQAAAEAGWTVVIDEEIAYDNRVWQGALSQIKTAAPDLVVFEILDTAGTSTFIEQFLLDPPASSLLYAGYIASTPAIADMAAKGGAEGVIAMTVSAQLPGAVGDAFVAAWQQKFGSAPPLSVGAAIYDEVKMWAAAVAVVGNADDHAAVSAALRSLDYQGISGTYRFNSDQFVPVGDDTVPSQLLQVQDGALVPVMIGSVAGVPFKRPAWLP